MLDSKHFNSVLNNLETYDEEFVEVLDKIIKLGVSVARNTEELREEIMDYDDVYQIYITDLNFNFWLKISKGSIVYKKGINPLIVDTDRDGLTDLSETTLGLSPSYPDLDRDFIWEKVYS